jgi:Ran GTPase-activating protein (RanGAP) involved in mRNA processing and transport
VADPGERANAWVLEGIAMYLESLHKQGSYCTLGGWEAERLQFARYRALAGDFALPLAELAPLGREELQAHADIRKLYSHSAGLTQFLMDGGGGRYREIVGKYLAAIYRGEDDAGTLPKLLKSDGHTLSSIDAEYRRFLNVTDEDLAATPAPQRLRTVSLGRTAVTDEGLAALAGCKNLEWLDLSATKTTDAGFAHFSGNTKLTQLFLDGVKLTDGSLPMIAKFKELEELDLSNTSITDASLGSLAGLKKLKILYLTGTNVTDKAVPVLKGLKSLETLDLQGTKISAEASAELKRALPKLRMN